jgi:PAS domain-containing protein
MEGVSSHMQLGNSGPSTSRLSVQDQSAHDPPSSHSDDSTLSDSDCEEAVLQPVAHSASHRAHPVSSFPVANSAAHHAHSHTVVQAGPTSPDPSHHFDFLDAVNFLSHQSTTSSPYFTFDLLPTVSMVSVHASVASNSAMTQHTSAPAVAIPSNALVDPSARFENFVMELDPRLARFNSFRFIRRILQRRTPEDVIVQAVQNMMESIKNDRSFFESMLNFDLRSAVARDVVVRHQVEDAEVYVQASKFPSMMVVFSGRLHKYNSAFVEISSFSREDLDRAEFEPLEVFEEVSIPIILNSAMKMRANRKLTTNSIVTVLRRKDGRRVEYCTGITYVRDSLGNLLSSVMTFIPMPEADTM